MSEIIVEQAVLLGRREGDYHICARSPGFAEEWVSSVEKICAAFGRPPAGASCPLSLYVQPLGRSHIAVVQVSAAPGVSEGELAFHVLVLREDDYSGLGGDPFAVAERCPAAWQARGALPALTWPRVPFPPRSFQQVRQVLKRADGPNLLGGAQVLLDGGKLVFERAEPDPQVLRDLWMLLPTRSRSEMWPATFAFGNSPRFHAIVVPSGLPEKAAAEFPHYLTDEQAGDYPEGRYELKLQTAAEEGDQEGLDRLFARRTTGEIWKLGLLLLAGMVLIPILIRWIGGPTVRKEPTHSGSASGSTEPGSAKP
jgi:hypothetical protein